VIRDKSSIHAFSLDGPHGFAHDFTRIPFIGTKTATITLKAGRYKYYCPNHESIMFGHFRVT
jgi:plastocyanin